MCSVDDVMLLTLQTLQPNAKTGQLEEPGLHALAVVDRIEPDPQGRHLRVVHAHINLTAAPSDDGASPLLVRVVCV